MSSNLYYLYPKLIFRNFQHFHGASPLYSVYRSISDKRRLKRHFSTQGDPEAAHTLNDESAKEFVRKLTPTEREFLLESIHQVASEETKAEYRDQLAAFRWRSQFGRPTRLAQLGDVDPSGTYCPLPEDWLLQKYTESVAPPTRKQLTRVGLINSIPFIGFGFLDNFFMITFGDTIEAGLGGFVVISTMTAAALGNTISDILGIGSAWYVEQGVSKLGFKPPKLLPIQMDMKVTRQAANWGRTIGVTIGCILGMSPLLFLKPKETECEEEVK